MRANRLAAIEQLLAGRSHQETADHVGVSLRTLRRWLQDPGFRGALRQAQSDRLDALAAQLSTRAELAIHAITETMTTARSDNARLRAAGLILDHSLRFSDRQLEQRLIDLEQRLDTLEGIEP